jgi:hypothetical protein
MNGSFLENRPAADGHYQPLAFLIWLFRNGRSDRIQRVVFSIYHNRKSSIHRQKNRRKSHEKMAGCN